MTGHRTDPGDVVRSLAVQRAGDPRPKATGGGRAASMTRISGLAIASRIGQEGICEPQAETPQSPMKIKAPEHQQQTQQAIGSGPAAPGRPATKTRTHMAARTVAPWNLPPGASAPTHTRWIPTRIPKGWQDLGQQGQWAARAHRGQGTQGARPSPDQSSVTRPRSGPAPVPRSPAGCRWPWHDRRATPR